MNILGRSCRDGRCSAGNFPESSSWICWDKLRSSGVSFPQGQDYPGKALEWERFCLLELGSGLMSFPGNGRIMKHFALSIWNIWEYFGIVGNFLSVKENPSKGRKEPEILGKRDEEKPQLRFPEFQRPLGSGAAAPPFYPKKNPPR